MPDFKYENNTMQIINEIKQEMQNLIGVVTIGIGFKLQIP